MQNSPHSKFGDCWSAPIFHPAERATKPQLSTFSQTPIEASNMRRPVYFTIVILPQSNIWSAACKLNPWPLFFRSISCHGWIPALAHLPCPDQATEYRLLLPCRTILSSHYGKSQLFIYQSCIVALLLRGQRERGEICTWIGGPTSQPIFQWWPTLKAGRLFGRWLLFMRMRTCRDRQSSHSIHLVCCAINQSAVYIWADWLYNMDLFIILAGLAEIPRVPLSRISHQLTIKG